MKILNHYNSFHPAQMHELNLKQIYIKYYNGIIIINKSSNEGRSLYVNRMKNILQTEYLSFKLMAYQSAISRTKYSIIFITVRQPTWSTTVYWPTIRCLITTHLLLTKQTNKATSIKENYLKYSKDEPETIKFPLHIPNSKCQWPTFQTCFHALIILFYLCFYRESKEFVNLYK